jgi:hypothetical protein
MSNTYLNTDSGSYYDKNVSESYDETSNASTDESIDEKKDVQIDLKTFFSVKELCYYKMIDKFFKNYTTENIIKMIDIIESKSSISLRILDWFVTKYSKKRIDCGNKEGSEVFDVKISYKSQLKAYKKRYFDPFRRRKKFKYYFENSNNTNVYTTLGQLNFFKWAFTNGIIAYVDNNLNQISKEMNSSNKEDKLRKKIKIDEKKKIEEDTKLNIKKINDNSDKNKKKQKTKLKDNIKINSTPFKTGENGQAKIVLTFD